MTEQLKCKINELQYRIDRDSKYTLLIFDNQEQMDKFKRKQFNGRIPKEISMTTLNYILFNNGLDGRKFKSYRFMFRGD